MPKQSVFPFNLIGRFRRLKPALYAPTSYDQKAWSTKAQRGELEFHKKDKKRQHESFNKNSESLFEHFGLFKNSYRGCTVIDLGAGSKLRSKYFADSKLIAIEPLADRFLEEVPWCDLDDAHAVYSSPAEERIPDCVESADLLVSINVLDHCYDFHKVIENIRDYLKPNGLAFLSFDEHKFRDSMHPLILSDKICRDEFSSVGLKVQKHSTGFGGRKDISKGRETYGHGDFCLNYWLSRA